MASSPTLILISLMALIAMGQADDPKLTVFNNCPFTIWPGIQPNGGGAVLHNGGFMLASLNYSTFPIQGNSWSGRIWARTNCAQNNGQFSCASGDCGAKIECGGQGGTPASLAEVAINQGGSNKVDYRVSLVDGYNLPISISPQGGQGQCPVLACQAQLLDSCPDELKQKSSGDGKVVACQSGSKALGKDELCCKGSFNTADTCKPSPQSDFFKKACPNAITYAFDKPQDSVDCTTPPELKVIFCP